MTRKEIKTSVALEMGENREIIKFESKVNWTEIGVQIFLATMNDFDDLIFCNSIRLPRLQKTFYSI